MTHRKTTPFDLFAGLLFLALFLGVLAVAHSLKSGTPVKAPPEPQPSILARPN